MLLTLVLCCFQQRPADLARGVSDCGRRSREVSTLMTPFSKTGIKALPCTVCLLPLTLPKALVLQPNQSFLEDRELASPIDGRVKFWLTTSYLGRLWAGYLPSFSLCLPICKTWVVIVRAPREILCELKEASARHLTWGPAQRHCPTDSCCEQRVNSTSGRHIGLGWARVQAGLE